MQKKDMITALLLSLLVLVIWYSGNLWWEKRHPAPPVDANATTQSAPTTGGAATTQYSSTQPTTASASDNGPQISAGPVILHAVPSTEPIAPIVLGSATPGDKNYAMEVVFSAVGAGIDRVTLNDFPAPVDPTEKKSKGAYQFEKPVDDDAAGTRVLATRRVVVNGKEIDLSSIAWEVAPPTANTAQFYVYLDDANGHVVRVTKTFRIQGRNAADGNKGYELTVTQEIADVRPDAAKAIAPLSAWWVINGPAAPPSEQDQGGDRSVVSTTVESGSAVSSVETNTLSEFKPEAVNSPKPGEAAPAPAQNPAHTLFSRPIAWVGQSSAYFGALVLPATPGTPGFNIRAAVKEVVPNKEPIVTLSFESPNAAINPATPSSISMTVFFGPKWREVLRTPHYDTYPRQYSKLLEYRSALCGWCAIPAIINSLVWLLGVFHKVFRDWGLSIICLVLCVRTLLHPLTKRAQVKMMGMSKLSPEIEKLKKKYADQPDVLNREMMKIYKEQGGAILGCLPMFLQTPIWIALWSALQGTFELRQAPFLYGWTWIKDLAKPDALIHFSAGLPIPFTSWHLYSINILPIAMAVVTYINQKYFMPMPPATTPEQEQQQKIQRSMSIFFPLMFYALPSGLNLYYLTSTSLGIIESKIIRDHIKEQEELAKSQRELVTTKATRGSKYRDDKEEPPGKPGVMARLMEAMAKAQQHAEELRKESEKKKKKP